MYNRYLRRDTGTYTRTDGGAPPEPPPQQTPGTAAEDARGTWERLLARLHLEDVLARFDSSDLLLLLLLLFLWREDADEEVLIALGLLLIL